MDRIHAYLVHSDWKQYLKSWTDQNDEKESYDNFEKENEKEDTDIVIKVDHLQFGDKFISEFGFGEKHDYIKLTPKYKSIYDELMFNSVCPIDETEWQRKLMKAINCHKIAISSKNQKLKCKHYDQNYGLYKNQPIEIRHILAIILYTDLSEFCRSLRETYRMIEVDNVKETEYKQVAKRHREFYYIGRALFEAIEFLGKPMKPTMKVYHGLGVCYHLYYVIHMRCKRPNSIL